uniref:CHM Rab escort protein n=1 Tax=Myotis myotis TaxID=51298 RepID=A0A7J7YCB9_MYOMY|nr:CHM Rab escort protein [Myotis myotis]
MKKPLLLASWTKPFNMWKCFVMPVRICMKVSKRLVHCRKITLQ